MYPGPEARDELGLVALPDRVTAILKAERAPPRLVAHLTLVHDVARRVLRRMHRAWPWLVVDDDDVAFGAATHDVGKARVVAELSSPGTQHEAVGEVLLLEMGVSARQARFARSHGEALAGLAIEDLIVIVADTAWKAKRRADLDYAVVEAIVAAGAAAGPPHAAGAL